MLILSGAAVMSGEGRLDYSRTPTAKVSLFRVVLFLISARLSAWSGLGSSQSVASTNTAILPSTKVSRRENRV
jgi:hypothetical protein